MRDLTHNLNHNLTHNGIGLPRTRIDMHGHYYKLTN